MLSATLVIANMHSSPNETRVAQTDGATVHGLFVSFDKTPASSNRKANDSSTSTTSIPSSTTSTQCGSWTQDQAFVAWESTWGPIVQCQLFGYTWVVIASGVPSPAAAPSSTQPPDLQAPDPSLGFSSPGAIFTFTCESADENCLGGGTEMDAATWTVTPFESAGFFNPQLPLTATTFTALTAFGQVNFNVVTGDWFTEGSAAFNACTTEYGSFVGAVEPSDPSYNSVVQSFINQNPSCSTAE
jgi:hypothetical protein